MSIFGDFENFVTSKVWPFLRNVGKGVVQAEIHVLEPLAANAVAGAEQAIVTAAASGSTANLGQVLAGIITETGKQAELAAVTAGATSLLAAVGTALATNSATKDSLATAKPGEQ